MTNRDTSDPYCNAVMREWDRARENGDRQTQDLFLALCEQHKAPTIDWKRVAKDAEIEVPDPISESRAIGIHEALIAMTYEVGRIIDHSGSSDLIAVYNHARSLLGEATLPTDWITQADAKTLARSLRNLTTQVDRLLAAGLTANPEDFITALRPPVGRRATSLERKDEK